MWRLMLHPGYFADVTITMVTLAAEEHGQTKSGLLCDVTDVDPHIWATN